MQLLFLVVISLKPKINFITFQWPVSPNPGVILAYLIMKLHVEKWFEGSGNDNTGSCFSA